MKKLFFIFTIVLFLMGGLNFIPVFENFAYSGTVRICPNWNSCDNTTDWRCTLYTSSGTEVATCEIHVDGSRCCDVTVEQSGNYYWVITNGSKTCTGSTFFYNNEPLYTVNFDCNNCSK